MLHEISPNRFDLGFDNTRSASPEDLILCFEENSILVKSDGDKFFIPQKKDFGVFKLDPKKIYIGELDGNGCFLANPLLEIPDGFVYLTPVQIRQKLEKMHKWVVAVGIQLNSWYRDNKFCGRCGGKLSKKHDERALQCGACNNIIFPKLSPAIIVAITKGDRLLLAKNRLSPTNHYSLIAGYIEAGETVEEAVKREVMEEVGINVENIRYYKSQPWPFSSSLMMGFTAECIGDSEIVLDEKELSDAGWFQASDLPEIPNRDSISGELIRLFRDGKI
jgi:NAD+ diphosphatase